MGTNSVPAHAEMIQVTIDKLVFSPEELGQSSWLVAGNIPGISRQLAKKLNPDQTALLGPASALAGRSR
jgi:hypothetical protein